MNSGAELERLIQLLAKLPGLGPRSARRAVLYLVKKKDSLLVPLARALDDVIEHVTTCSECGNVDTQDPCQLCRSPTRDRKVICVVEEVADLWALERTASFKGLYHVIGGTLSALDGVGPEDLFLAKLVERASEDLVQEVILAMNATVDGQTTAHYITGQLEDTGVAVSRLAHGVPVGGELDYLDDGTLSQALKARQPF